MIKFEDNAMITGLPMAPKLVNLPLEVNQFGVQGWVMIMCDNMNVRTFVDCPTVPLH